MQHTRKRNYTLDGKTFGRWTVISKVLPTKDRSIWKCVCKCGNIKNIVQESLLKGTSKSCGCLKKELLWEGCGELSHSYFHIMELSAKKRKIKFSVDIKYLWDLFLKQNRKCALSGLSLVFSKKWVENKNQTASMDRIDSNKGYEINNIQWIHKDINYMKMDIDETKFLEYCNIISKYQTK